MVNNFNLLLHAGFIDAIVARLRHRRRPADKNAGTVGQIVKRIDHAGVVAGELVPVFPVLRLGVIGPEQDDDRIWLKRQRVGERALQHIRMFAVAQQCAAAQAEVMHVPVGAEHLLQPRGIILAAFKAGADRDAIADTGHPNWLRIISGLQRLGGCSRDSSQNQPGGQQNSKHLFHGELFNRDFPFGFWPKTGVSLTR